MKNFNLTRNYLQQAQESPNYYEGRAQPQQYGLNLGNAQQLLQMMNQERQYNPFNSNIHEAVSSARASLAMTPDQEDKALRKAALTFGDEIGKQPKKRGLLANFASVGKALGPAIIAHDEADDASMVQNNALANQILKAQAEKEALARAEEEKAYSREWEREKFEETQRHNKASEYLSSLQYKLGNGLDKQKYKELLKSHNKSTETLNMINQLENSYESLGNIQKPGFWDNFGSTSNAQAQKNIVAETAKKLLKDKYGLEVNRNDSTDFIQKLKYAKDFEMKKLREINDTLGMHDDSSISQNHPDIVLVRSQSSGEVVPIFRSQLAAAQKEAKANSDILELFE